MTDAAPVDRPVRRPLDRTMGWLTALILACAYGFTLAPSITAGDAGELITAAWTLGVPHAPGYPLYTLLGFGMIHLPLGPDPAFRLNAFSMLCALGAAMVVYLLLLRRGQHPVFAGVVALGLGSGPTWWGHAVVAEVYPLNLLVLALFWLLLDADLREGVTRRRTWLLGGLALTTHQTSILALVPALLISRQVWPKTERGKRTRLALGMGALPCVLYLYTLLAAQNPNALAWGRPDTLSEWLRFTLLPVSQQVSDGSVWLHLSYLMELLFGAVATAMVGVTGHPAEMGAAVVLALVGLATVLPQRAGDPAQRIWAWSCITYPLTFLLFTHPGASSLTKLDPYYLPVWLTLWLLVPEGYRSLLASQEASPSRKHLGPLLKPILELVLVLSILITGAQSAVVQNREAGTLVRDSYTAQLHALPPGAVLLCDLDDLFVLWYLQRVEGIRPDVVPVLAYFPASSRDRYWAGWIYDELARDHPALAVDIADPSPLQERLRGYIARVRQQRPVCMTFHDPGYLDPLYPPLDFTRLGTGWLPLPLSWRAVGPDEELSATALAGVVKYYLRGEVGEEEYARWRARYGDSYEQGYLLARYMTGLVSTARLLQQLGDGMTALACYERAIAIAPGMFEHYPVAVHLARETNQTLVALHWQEQFVSQIGLAHDRTGAPELRDVWVQEQTTLARMTAELGEPGRALLLLAEVLRVDPDYGPARELQQALAGTGPR